MKGTGAKRNVCPGSCVSTGAKFPVAPVESAPMPRDSDLVPLPSVRLSRRSTAATAAGGFAAEHPAGRRYTV